MSLVELLGIWRRRRGKVPPPAHQPGTLEAGKVGQGRGREGARGGLRDFGFWFLVCNTATQLALRLHQERIQVVRGNKIVRRIPTESNGTLTMDLGFEDIRLRRYKNEREKETNTHP